MVFRPAKNSCVKVSASTSGWVLAGGRFDRTLVGHGVYFEPPEKMMVIGHVEVIIGHTGVTPPCLVLLSCLRLHTAGERCGYCAPVLQCS